MTKHDQKKWQKNDTTKQEWQKNAKTKWQKNDKRMTKECQWNDCVVLVLHSERLVEGKKAIKETALQRIIPDPIRFYKFKLF